MKRTVRSVGILLLCQLSIATSASAECAWVLWGTNIDKGDLASTPMNGYSTLAECQREQASWESREAAYQRNRAESNARGPSTQYVLGVAVSYRCLPDTIDPRGPKGK